MRKLYWLLVLCCVLIFPLRVVAEGSLLELRTKIEFARSTLIEMFNGKVDEIQQKKVRDSAAAVSMYLQEIQVSKNKGDQLKELRDTWDLFRATREQELVPAILQGDDKAARKIALGVQKARLTKMYELILALQDESV